MERLYDFNMSSALDAQQGSPAELGNADLARVLSRGPVRPGISINSVARSGIMLLASFLGLGAYPSLMLDHWHLEDCRSVFPRRPIAKLELYTTIISHAQNGNNVRHALSLRPLHLPN
jgi:hypothetical protein